MKMTIFRAIPSPSRIKDLCLLICSLSIFYLLLHHSPQTQPQPFFIETTSTTTSTPTTSLLHILFSVASSSRSFIHRKPYLRLWYNPNTTRAVVFLDNTIPKNKSFRDPSLPPTLISADTSSFPYTYRRGFRSAIRVARIVKEAVLLNETDVRWFVFGDDDTVFVKENLVRILSGYDHDQWYYVGSGSESYEQSMRNSFGMAFGGGGFAISHSLARVLAGVLDSCLMRYPDLYGSDARVYSCLAELGVGLTHEPGFHQVDVRGDISGMLSAHPLTPLLSLHHLDLVDPIFPNMTKPRAVKHLFRAVNADPGRALQQSVCYDRSKSLTISVSWGYAIQIFEGNLLLPEILQLQRTFMPWSRRKDLLGSLYMFNTKDYARDPCKRPIVFFLESVAYESNKVRTNYIRYNIANCSRTRALPDLQAIKVLSGKLDLGSAEVKAMRRHCCDVLPSSSRSMDINIRPCRTSELIAMQT